MRTVTTIVALAALTCFGGGCMGSGGGADADANWVRASAGCNCSETMEDGCQCNHCAGGEGELCYCGTGGCECGGMMALCQCAHCTGKAGADECGCGGG